MIRNIKIIFHSKIFIVFLVVLMANSATAETFLISAPDGTGNHQPYRFIEDQDRIEIANYVTFSLDIERLEQCDPDKAIADLALLKLTEEVLKDYLRRSRELLGLADEPDVRVFFVRDLQFGSTRAVRETAPYWEIDSDGNLIAWQNQQH